MAVTKLPWRNKGPPIDATGGQSAETDAAPPQARSPVGAIKRRLLLGAGVIVLLQAVTALAALGWLNYIEGLFQESRTQQELALNSSYEMEINIVESGLGVIKYLRKAEPEFRDDFAHDSADFEQYFQTYKSSASSDEHRELVAQIDALHTEFEDRSKALMAAKDREVEFYGKFLTLAPQLDERLGSQVPDYRLLPVAGDADLQRMAARAQSDAVEALVWFVEYIGSSNPQSLETARGEANQATTGLSNLSQRDLPRVWKNWAVETRTLIAGALQAIEGIAVTGSEIDVLFTGFIDSRRDLDDILDEKIQIRTMADLDLIKQKKSNAVQSALFTLISFTVLATALGLFLALRFGNLLVRPVTALADAAGRIRDGAIGVRVIPYSKGEIGVLERGFNAMAQGLEEAQAKLESANRDLEAQVAHRTAALARTNEKLLTELRLRAQSEEHLRSAIEQAEAANHSKSVFLANMSHELRTPLNAIIGFSEIMDRQMLGPISNARYSEYAADILTSGRHLLSLINDILDLSRVEAGKFDLMLESVDPAQAVAQVVREMAVLADNADLVLSPLLGKNLPEIVVDPLRLRQMLLNLLANAIKFSSKGERIVVRARFRNRDGGVVEFSVIDTGPGIPADELEKVQTPFGRAEAALARDRAGVGLGLPLTKILAEMHGGAFRLSSSIGRGTNATVILPVVAKPPALERMALLSSATMSAPGDSQPVIADIAVTG